MMPMKGEVIAVGPGARDEAGKLVPLDVKVRGMNVSSAEELHG